MPFLSNPICGDTCDTSVCGNGTIEFPEECDDGGTSNGDGCASSCQISTEGFNWKMPIVIESDLVDENLTDFPVLLKDSNFPSSVYTNTLSNGSDIVFTTDVNGNDGVPHEVVSWNTAGETSRSVGKNIKCFSHNGYYYIFMVRQRISNQSQ